MHDQLHNPLTNPHQRALTIFFVTSSLIIGEAHQFTSILRYYGSFRLRAKAYRLQRIPFWILYAAGFLVVCILFTKNFVPNQVVATMLAIFEQAEMLFPVVLIQHFCAQAMAVGLIYCRVNGYTVSKSERSSISVIAWMLTAAGGFSIANPFSFSVPPPFLSQVCVAGAAFAVLAFIVHVLRRGLATGEWLPAGAAIMWMNLAIFVLLPIPPVMLYVWLFVPVFFHASQHWALAWVTQRSEAAQQRLVLPSTRVGDICRLVLPVQTVSLIVLFFPLLVKIIIPNSQTVSQFFGSDTLSVGWSMLVFYIHYFADRLVWRPKT